MRLKPEIYRRYTIMNYRYMRIVVFFDLPTTSSEDLREYNRFRKYLIKSGFIMMQESVYTKIVLNNTVGDAVKAGIRKNKAKKGLIQMLTVTEKQFEKMEYVCGNKKSDVIDSDEKLVIL